MARSRLTTGILPVARPGVADNTPGAEDNIPEVDTLFRIRAADMQMAEPVMRAGEFRQLAAHEP